MYVYIRVRSPSGEAMVGVVITLVCYIVLEPQNQDGIHSPIKVQPMG